MTLVAAFTPKLTADGSFTFFSESFGESFHSQFGARQEAEAKFIQPTLLAEKALHSDHLCLLDICYGLGYNTAAALETIWAVNPDCKVEWVGLELDERVPQAAIAHNLHQTWSQSVQVTLQTLATSQQANTTTLQAQLLLGDARQTIQQVLQLTPIPYSTPHSPPPTLKFDAIFLDPFSPPHCPQLWTVEFLTLVAQCLKPNGRLATYSCAASVRTALKQSGLFIGSTTPVGRRAPGTVASPSPDNLPPLSQQEQEHFLTRAAIPYWDPDLCNDAATILQRRVAAQQVSSLESTSQWKKRWLMSRS